MNESTALKLNIHERRSFVCASLPAFASVHEYAFMTMADGVRPRGRTVGNREKLRPRCSSRSPPPTFITAPLSASRDPQDSMCRLVFLASILACLTHVSGLLLAQRPVPRASHHRAPATLRVCTGLRQEACRSRTIVAQASEAGMTLLEDKDQYDALIADATKENRAAAGSIQGHGRHCHSHGPQAPPQSAGLPVAERPVWPPRHRGDQVLRELVPRVQGNVA